MTRAANSSAVVSSRRRLCGCSGVRSSKTVGRDFSSGWMAVDQFHLHQGEVFLALDRQADRPLDDQAGAQAQPADLAGRDVNVFRRGEVVVGGAAQEAVAVGQHFEGAGAAHDLAALDLLSDDGDDQLAAVHAGVFGDAFALGQGEQLRHGQTIQVIQAKPRWGARACRRGGRGDGPRDRHVGGFAGEASPGQVARPFVAAGDGHNHSPISERNKRNIGPSVEDVYATRRGTNARLRFRRRQKTVFQLRPNLGTHVKLAADFNGTPATPPRRNKVKPADRDVGAELASRFHSSRPFRFFQSSLSGKSFRVGHPDRTSHLTYEPAPTDRIIPAAPFSGEEGAAWPTPKAIWWSRPTSSPRSTRTARSP